MNWRVALALGLAVALGLGGAGIWVNSQKPSVTTLACPTGKVSLPVPIASPSASIFSGCYIDANGVEHAGTYTVIGSSDRVQAEAFWYGALAVAVLTVALLPLLRQREQLRLDRPV